VENWKYYLAALHFRMKVCLVFEMTQTHVVTFSFFQFSNYYQCQHVTVVFSVCASYSEKKGERKKVERLNLGSFIKKCGL